MCTRTLEFMLFGNKQKEILYSYSILIWYINCDKFFYILNRATGALCVVMFLCSEIVCSTLTGKRGTFLSGCYPLFSFI